MNKTRVFISYSWDSEIHKAWVKKIADSLEEIVELHVIWDGYDLDALKDKNKYMESGIYESDYVLVIATNKYKEKADSRNGGVGIETYLASAVHWDGLMKTDRTKLIVILREPDAVPNYLKGHLFIDFTSDSSYAESEAMLLKIFRGEQNSSRPQKRRTLTGDEHFYSFNKIEDLIRVNHANRRTIVNKEQGTDYSGSNRIKYELWETKSPAASYYLALANNINITQTVNHAIEQLKFARIRPSDITVLRPRLGRADQNLIQNIFTQSGLTTNVHELTYKDYIWDYCIDESLKCADQPTEIANYTDQSLRYDNDNKEPTLATSARDHIVNLLQQPSPTSAHLVVAPGGMGKTSLCLGVAAKLHNRQDLHSSVILIQAESIKRYVAENGATASRLDSVFQLYELYARHNNFDLVFDRNTFELAFLSGNLVVIIDGLDEFVSLFQESFNLESFLASLDEFHKELGSSSVLLTTRNNQLIEDCELERLSIAKYELLGFDKTTCESYLRRRFKKYSNSQNIAASVQSKIDKVQLREHDERVVPFFADIAATVEEDRLLDNTPDEFEVGEDPTPYPSNNDLTDHIIYSVMRREEIRHGLDLSVYDVIQLLSGLIVDFSKRWPKSEMLERLILYYDARGPVLCSKIELNPLLVNSGTHLELRYSFLASYFEVIFLLDCILRHSLEREFIKSLARLNSETNEFRELKKYFTSQKGKLLDSSAILIQRLRNQAEQTDSSCQYECEQARRSISSLINLSAQVVGGSAQHVTETVLKLYGIKQSIGKITNITGLHLRGDFPAMDFSDMIISNSRFVNYKNLLSCKFENTKFLYCHFDSCFDSSITSSLLDPSSLDQTCELGDLREFLDLSRADKQAEIRLIETESRKFLHSFFKGDRFIDNNKFHIRFSTKVTGLTEKKFDKLIAHGYIRLKIAKEVDKFYEIDDSFKPSVRRLLTNNYTDAKMKKFHKFVSE